MDDKLDSMHVLALDTFQNINTLTPAVRSVVSSAKVFEKSYQTNLNLTHSFVESISPLAQSALHSHSSGVVGEVITEMMHTFTEVEEHRSEIIKAFINEIIIPLESKVEDEITGVKSIAKSYAQDSKIRQEAYDRSKGKLEKATKKCSGKKVSAKMEEMKKECERQFDRNHNELTEARQYGLRRALTEEKKIFCFIAERLVQYSHALAVHCNKITHLFKDRIHSWVEVASRSTELHSDAEDVIQNPTNYVSKDTRKKSNRTFSFSKGSSSRASKRFERSTLRRPTADYGTSRPTSYAATRATSPSPSIPSHVSYSASTLLHSSNHNHESLSRADVSVPESRSVVSSMSSQSPSKPNETNHVASVSSRQPSMTSVKSPDSERNIPVEPNRNQLEVGLQAVSVQQKISQLNEQLKKSAFKFESENGIVVRALYDHEASDSAQLSFKQGDHLLSVSEAMQGWQYGRHQPTGRAGWFPAAFVEIVEETRNDVSTPSSFGHPITRAPLQSSSKQVSPTMPNPPSVDLLPRTASCNKDVKVGPVVMPKPSLVMKSSQGASFRQHGSQSETSTLPSGDRYGGTLNKNPISPGVLISEPVVAARSRLSCVIMPQSTKQAPLPPTESPPTASYELMDPVLFMPPPPLPVEEDDASSESSMNSEVFSTIRTRKKSTS